MSLASFLELGFEKENTYCTQWLQCLCTDERLRMSSRHPLWPGGVGWIFFWPLTASSRLCVVGIEGSRRMSFSSCPSLCVGLWAARLMWSSVWVWGQRDGNSLKEKKKKYQSFWDDRGPVWAGKQDRGKKLYYHWTQNSKHMVDSFCSSGAMIILKCLFKCFFIYVCFLAGCPCCRTARTRPWTQHWVETSFTSRTAGFRNSLGLL